MIISIVIICMFFSLFLVSESPDFPRIGCHCCIDTFAWCLPNGFVSHQSWSWMCSL